MHAILASGLVSIGKELVGRACESFKLQSPQESFKARLEDAALSPLKGKEALALHKSSLERQIMQDPEFKSLGLQAPSLEPVCITLQADGSYSLLQGTKRVRLDAKASSLGTLLQNYYKTCEALEASPTAPHWTTHPKTFSFHPAAFS